MANDQFRCDTFRLERPQNAHLHSEKQRLGKVGACQRRVGHARLDQRGKG